MALSAQVDQKKNEKHIHTEGRRRNAIGCSGSTGCPEVPVAAGTGAHSPARSLIASRCHHRIAITHTTITEAQAAATRQEPVAALSPVRNSGAAAQPRLPAKPCVLNA